jgi:hypothetical protein
MTSTPAALRSVTFRSISANRYGGMASMRRAVRMGWAVSLAWRSGTDGGPSWQPTADGAAGLRSARGRGGAGAQRTRSSPLPIWAREPSVRRPSAR